MTDIKQLQADYERLQYKCKTLESLVADYKQLIIQQRGLAMTAQLEVYRHCRSDNMADVMARILKIVEVFGETEHD